MTISKHDILKTVFRCKFTEKVADRKNLQKWNIPKKWDAQVDTLIRSCICKGVDTVNKMITFVNAQFLIFDKQLSRKYFNLEYPPIGVFKSKASMSRYYDEANRQMSINHKRLNIPHIIKSEYNRTEFSKNGRIELDKLKLHIMNGSISSYTVAYLIDKLGLTPEVCEELAEVVKLSNNENLANIYIDVQNLKKKGELI